MGTVRELKLIGGLPLIGQAIGVGSAAWDMPDQDVHCLVMARDSRLWLAPLGASVSIAQMWRDCGQIGAWADDPLDALVHQTWADYWAAGGQ